MSELHWAAGFFDGEGNVSFVRNGLYRRFIVSITQNQREELDRFRAAVGGVGTINGPYTRKKQQGNRQPYYTYQCQARDEVLALIEQLRPVVCSTKRAQMDAAVRSWQEYQETHPPTDWSAVVQRSWATRKSRMAAG